MNEVDQQAFNEMVATAASREFIITQLKREIEMEKALREEMVSLAVLAEKKLHFWKCLFIGITYAYVSIWWWKG